MHCAAKGGWVQWRLGGGPELGAKFHCKQWSGAGDTRRPRHWGNTPVISLPATCLTADKKVSVCMLGRKSAANINPSEKSHSYHRVSVQQSDCGLQLMTLPSPGTVRSWSGSSGEGDSSQGTGGHADTTASLESNQEISVDAVYSDGWWYLLYTTGARRQEMKYPH